MLMVLSCCSTTTKNGTASNGKAEFPRRKKRASGKIKLTKHAAQRFSY
jgi:hypothetical protein